MNTGFVSVIVAGLTPFIVLTLLFLGIGYHAIAWQPPAIWTAQFGPGVVTAVAADSSGVYAGGFGGDAGFHLFLSRYNLEGGRVWNQDFGNFPNEITGISLGTDGVYVAGFMDRGFVRKYDFNGSLHWTANDSRVDNYASISANSGRVFVGYDFNSALIRAYDTNGNSLWTTSISNSSSPPLPQITSDSNHVYAVGYGAVSGYLRSYNFDGTLNWAENLTCSCAPYDVAVDSSGIYIVGTFQSTGLSGTLAKYDLVGDQVWVKNFDSPDATTIGTPRISVDSSGIYLAGTTSFSGYLIRYDSNGNHVWTVEIPLSVNSASAGQDGVYVGGAASNNAVLSKYGQSSSLVLFGVNPPFSFGLVALLGAVVVLSLLWLRRQRKRVLRRPKSAMPYSAPKPSEDDSKWMKRPP